MNNQDLIEYQWPYLLSFLDIDEPLDESAKRYGALVRRRGVKSGEDLLRLALVYSFCGLSLRQTAAWAEASEIAAVSDVALLKRFRGAADWLGHLVATKLAARSESRLQFPLKLILVDATTVNAPGNTGTDWRVHLAFDLAAFKISDVKLTDGRGGESLKRYKASPGDVLVADRGYSRRTDFAAATRKQADFIVRLNWATVPMTDLNDEKFNIVDAVRGIPEAEVRDFEVKLKADHARNVPALPVRVIAVRKSEAAAAESRKKILRRASKKQTTPDPRTLEMAAYVIVITSLVSSRITAKDVLEIYRFRWQVELVFKRLKSLFDLDGLPAKDPDLARAFIFSKILAALLLDDFTEAFISFSPWGFNIK